MSQSPDTDIQTDPAVEAGTDVPNHEGDADQVDPASDTSASDAADEVADEVTDDVDVAVVVQDDESDADADADADDDEASDADSVDSEANSETGGSGRRVATVARLEREGEIAADFLEKLLDIADLDGDLDVDVEGERASVAIVDSADGRVPRRLVGQNGEVLEALQELSRLAVQARTGDRSRLMLDVAGHRARRREQLVAHAQEAVAKVKESGEPLRLDPMNPFERKIVHDAVAAAGLQSASEGVEPDRRIVVRPA